MLCSFELHLYFTEITTIDVRECKNHMKLKDKEPVVYWELFWIQPGASSLDPRAAACLHVRRSWPYYLQMQFNREILWELFSYSKEYCSVLCLFSTLLRLMISEIYDFIGTILEIINIINSTNISLTGTVQ